MTKDSQAFLSFRNVKKTYDRRSLVVRDFNLDVRRGEFVTLLGPSGSGKTTVLMMLAGFEHVTSGDISIDGVSITRSAPYERNIGMVFQNYALFPHMTVHENLAYPLKVRKLSRGEIRDRVADYLKLVELENFGDRHPGQLSGGQRQRVALARALIFEPALVLLDEPLSALDKKLREQMQFEITRLHSKLGCTMVYVTHDQAEALTMSDRIAVFDQGVVQQFAAPDELYEKPANAFVAGFIGENNLIRGLGAAKGLRSVHDDGINDAPNTRDYVGVTLPDGTELHAAHGDFQASNNDCQASSRDYQPSSRDYQAWNSTFPDSHSNLQAPHGDSPATQGPCLISVRPEKLAISTARSRPATGDNVISARFVAQHYVGDFIRYYFELPDGTRIVVKTMNDDKAPSLADGQLTDLFWSVNHSFAFHPQSTSAVQGDTP